MYQLVRRRQTDPALEFLTTPWGGLKSLGFMRAFGESHLPLLGVIRWLSIGNLYLFIYRRGAALDFIGHSWGVCTLVAKISEYGIL